MSFKGWGEYPVTTGTGGTASRRSSKSAPLKVVILAGSFGLGLAKEMRQKGKCKNANMAIGDPPGVATGLLKLAGITVLEHQLLMLQKVDRLFPLEDSVYVVVPRAFLDQYRSLVESQHLLPPENIISNGAECPEDAPATSALKDLQLAIDTFKITCAVMALSSRVVFFQDFNFQRVVEHASIWKKDICGFSPMYEGEHIVEVASCPPLLELENNAKSICKVLSVIDKASPGCSSSNTAVLPLFMLQPGSLPLVKEYAESSSEGTIFSFLKFLQGKTGLYGIDLQFGAFRTISDEHLKFAEMFFLFYAGVKEFTPIHYPLPTQEDHKSHVHFKDERLPTSGEAKLPDEFGYMSTEYVDKVLHFITKYCTEQNNPFSGTRRVEYKVPTTFYMSTYRRQTAHAETGRTFPLTESVDASGRF